MIMRPNTRGWQLRKRALIDSGCFVIESSFGPQLTLTKGGHCLCRLTQEIAWKFPFSVRGRDRVGFHLILEDLFDVAFGKTSTHIWCFCQRNIATRWTILSASGRVNFRHTLLIAVSNEAYLSYGFRNIQNRSCFIARIYRIHYFHWKTISCIQNLTLKASILQTGDTGTLAYCRGKNIVIVG